MTAVNPASQAVAALNERELHNIQLHCTEVPVDSSALSGWLENALYEFKPDIWIGVGVAVECPVIRLENIGLNVRCFDVPDNKGTILKPTCIVEDGPLAYQSNLQHDNIVKNLRATGVPAISSFHAGTHLCNQMLYSVIHLSKLNQLNLISGFVHVPQSTENVALSSGRDFRCSSMSTSMMTDAIAVTVDCAVQQFCEATALT